MRTITNEGYVLVHLPVRTREGFLTGEFRKATIFVHNIEDKSQAETKQLQELPEAGLESILITGMDCSTFKTVKFWAASVKGLRPLEARDEQEEVFEEELLVG